MDIVVERKVLELVGWPTDTFSVDYSVLPPGRHEQDSAAGTTPLVDKSNDSNVHTVILFIPGNPGLNEWYIPFFSSILQALDSGYVVRGASYAGHSIDPRQIRVEETYYDDLPSDNQDTSDATTTAASQSTIVPPKTIAWTIDGQVHHKLDYMDKIAQEFQSLSSNPQRPLRWILVGHSIGCHLMQRMLVLRPDLAACTTTCLYLMPFIRMDAPSPHQQFLDWAAASPERSACILQTKARFLAQFSGKFLEKMLESIMDRPQDRVFTAQLIRQTRFPLNFLGIGVEEIRDLPQAIDVRHFFVNQHSRGVPAMTTMSQLSLLNQFFCLLDRLCAGACLEVHLCSSGHSHYNFVCRQ